MAKNNKIKENWKLIPGLAPTEMDLRILEFQNRGKLCPTRGLIKNQEQIEGIRRAGALNTAVLDEVANRIREGMSTEEINRIVHDFTIKHGGIPAPLNYEGFPKSCCTSVNEVVCHGIPSEDLILEEGDIINVDCTTILNGYYADASRMFVIGKTTEQKQRLVDVAWECLKVGEKVCAEPYVFVGDLGNAIQKHAHANGFSVVRDLCGHGVGCKFHEDPEVEHYGHKGTGICDHFELVSIDHCHIKEFFFHLVLEEPCVTGSLYSQLYGTSIFFLVSMHLLYKLGISVRSCSILFLENYFSFFS